MDESDEVGAVTVIVSDCCGADIRRDSLQEIPPPPGAILQMIEDPPEKWTGWRWVCTECGEQVGVMLNYGKLDLGIVRDSRLEPVMDIEYFWDDDA